MKASKKYEKYLLYMFLLFLFLGCNSEYGEQLPGHIKKLENLKAYPLPDNPDTLILERGQIETLEETGERQVVRYRIRVDGKRER